MTFGVLLMQSKRRFIVLLVFIIEVFLLSGCGSLTAVRIPVTGDEPLPRAPTLAPTPAYFINPQCPNAYPAAAEAANCGTHIYQCVGRSRSPAWTFPGGSRSLDAQVERSFQFEGQTLRFGEASVGIRQENGDYQLENEQGFFYIYTFTSKGYLWRGGNLNDPAACNSDPDKLCIFQECELLSDPNC